MLLCTCVTTVRIVRDGRRPEAIGLLDVAIGCLIVDRWLHSHDVLYHIPVAHLLPKEKMKDICNLHDLVSVVARVLSESDPAVFTLHFFLIITIVSRLE